MKLRGIHVKVPNIRLKVNKKKTLFITLPGNAVMKSGLLVRDRWSPKTYRYSLSVSVASTEAGRDCLFASPEDGTE